MLNTSTDKLQCPSLKLRSIDFTDCLIDKTASYNNYIITALDSPKSANLPVVNLATSYNNTGYYVGLNKDFKIQIQNFYNESNLLETLILVDENIQSNVQLKRTLLREFRKIVNKKFKEQRNYHNIATLIKIVNNEENLFTIDSYLKVLAFHLPEVKGSDFETDKILPIDNNLFLTAVLAYFDEYPNLHVSVINAILDSFIHYIRQHAVPPKSAVVSVFINKLLTKLDKTDFLIYDDNLHVKDLLFLAKRSNQHQLNFPLSQAVEFAKFTANAQDFDNPKINFKLTSKNDLIQLIDNLTDSCLISDVIIKGFKSMFSDEKVYGDNLLHINTNWSKDITINLNGLDNMIVQEIKSLSKLYLETKMTNFIMKCLNMIMQKSNHIY